jgi:SEC-C motif-containing protein
MTSCPCGSNKNYQECCGQYISGKNAAPTPEALMRSRYSAFTQANIDYITATMKGVVATDFDPISAKAWAQQAQWQRLEVLNAPLVVAESHKGFVEFMAFYQLNGRDQTIHEVSEFHLEKGQWYYVDGKSIAPRSKSSNNQQVGRNDPCSCGSGKKFKKCCS